MTAEEAAEWWETADPATMLLQLVQVVRPPARRLRLVAAHYCRWMESLPDYVGARPAAHLAEEVAEGTLGYNAACERAIKSHGTWEVVNLALFSDDRIGEELLLSLKRDEAPDRECGRDPAARLAVIRDAIRCIIGNPFRPVVCDPSWRTSTVVGLAAAIYADRAFDRLPILADALEEAGCANADVLAHCRGPGPHARGCWVVDLILGKS